MYVPDRRIVEQIQNYDNKLFVVWNNQKQYFELRRRAGVGDVLITPVTRSIYNTDEPKEFIALDERILWWIYEADSWKHDSARKYALAADSRWQAFHDNLRKKRAVQMRDLAKDTYNISASFFATKRAPKNPKPRFNNYKKQQWIRPDVQSVRSRLFSRSKANALAYNYVKGRE